MGRLELYKDKKANRNKLLQFGFSEYGNKYVFKTNLSEGFELTVECIIPDIIKTELKELETEEIYTLHLTDSEGEFVGKIREKYFKILNEISEKCFDTDIFQTKQAKDVISYIKEKYNDEIEYLWEKTPNNGIARRKDNKKWYLVILTVPKNRFGFDSDELVEVINLKVDKSKMQDILTDSNIYPAYHMNKKSWISIILDGNLDIEKIYHLIDKSYILVK